MIARSYISAVSLAVAAVFLAATPSASAQDINFACYGLAGTPTSSVVDSGSNVNLCQSNSALGATVKQNPTGYGITGAMDNKMFLSYTNGGYIVTDTTGNVGLGFADGDEYNQNNGNVLTSLGAYTPPAGTSPLQLIQPPPSIPSLGFGLGSGQGIPKAGTISVESTPSGGIFTFDAVDILDSTGTSYYTITGIEANGNTYTFDGTLTAQNCPPPLPNTPCLYQSITNPFSNVPIDQLDISITAYGLTRLDNIQIQAPEGGEGFAYLLLAGGACFGAMVFGSTNRTRNRDVA
jgi:hypothetical protein